MISGFMPGAPIGNPGHSVFAGAESGAIIVEPSGLIQIEASIFGTTSLVPAFDKGDRIQTRALVTDLITTDPINASGVMVRVRKPHATDEVSIAPTQTTTGNYQATLDLDTEGRWRVRWEASGANQELVFVVKPTQSD